MTAPIASLVLKDFEELAARVGDHFVHNGLNGRGCILSPCGEYRRLIWQAGGITSGFLGFGCLNPSVATHEVDDPTWTRIRKRASGYGGVLIWNAFDVRTKDPLEMKAHAKPSSDVNNEYIKLAVRSSVMTIIGWGEHASHQSRDLYLRRMLACEGAVLHALHINKSGQPKHPLYISAGVEPVLWDYIP